jgi:hypothetical protein
MATEIVGVGARLDGIVRCLDVRRRQPRPRPRHGLAGLRTIGTVFFWIALAAWLVTAAGLLRRPFRF